MTQPAIDEQLQPTSVIDSPQAWIVVVATFISTFTVFGVAYSFGSFFGPMADEFGSSRGETALFFSITTFLYFLLGVVSGRLADRYGPRPVLVFGAVAMVVGLFLTSLVNALWVGYLTYGFGVGIGVACAYVPMVATVGAWFDQRRTTALGVAVAGIGVGTLVVAPIAESLIARYGWRQTYVIMAVGSAVLLTLASIGARRPLAQPGQADVVAVSKVIRGSKEFAVLYVSVILITTALFTPFVFLDDYVTAREIDGSAAVLVGLIGLCSVVGRLGMGMAASKVSVNRLYEFSFLALGLSFLIWYSADDRYWQLMAFAVVLGISYGGFIALSPAVAANIFGTVGLGGLLGALYTAAGIGGLIGPPLSGALIDSLGYGPTILIDCAFALAGFAALTRLPASPKAVGSR